MNINWPVIIVAVVVVALAVFLYAFQLNPFLRTQVAAPAARPTLTPIQCQDEYQACSSSCRTISEANSSCVFQCGEVEKACLGI